MKRKPTADEVREALARGGRNGAVVAGWLERRAAEREAGLRRTFVVRDGRVVTVLVRDGGNDDA